MTSLRGMVLRAKMRTPQQQAIAKKQTAARARDYARELQQDIARERAAAQTQIEAAREQAKAEQIKKLSKVMTLGNRLASGGKDWSAAFVRAWQIEKAGGLELAVKGVTFGNRQKALRRLAAYNPADIRAFLVPEPENPVDPSAVAVMVGVQGGRGFYKVGYVPAKETAMTKALGNRLSSLRVVSASWQWKGRDLTTYGVRITLSA